jgi:hypothetical protein
MSCDFRIGTSVATLVSLEDLGCPAPDSHPFSPYSTVRTDGNGLPKGFGFPTASWVWDAENIDQVALDILLAFFSAETDAGVSLFITTRKDVGRGRQETADFSAIMSRPVDGQGKTMVPRSDGGAIGNLTVQFSHMVEQ